MDCENHASSFSIIGFSGRSGCRVKGISPASAGYVFMYLKVSSKTCADLILSQEIQQEFISIQISLYYIIILLFLLAISVSVLPHC